MSVAFVQVTNLHIRYEDGVTQEGHPFAVGLTLHSIGAFTVDEHNVEVFVKKAAMNLLRKAAQLSRLALYFDTGAEIMRALSLF
jgi:vacuolar protein sorting-associated protein 13A/C